MAPRPGGTSGHREEPRQWPHDRIDLGRPAQPDVVGLILDDHRRSEELMRPLRDAGSERSQEFAMTTLADRYLAIYERVIAGRTAA